MIETATLDEVLAFVETEGVHDAGLVALRKRWPDIHFTHCLEDEMCLEKPVREGMRANLYLVNAHNTCAVVTDHQPSATGLLITELAP